MTRETLTPINKFCPRSGKEVSSNSLVEYKGVIVGFCNPFCRDDFAARTIECKEDRRYFDILIKEKD